MSGHGAADFGLLAPSDHQMLAEHTGGTSSFYQQADKPLARLDLITRAQYLLGYYPSTAASNRQHRVVEVRVKRDAVRALFRHGYQVQPDPVDPEDLRRSFTKSRVEDVAAWLLRPSPAQNLSIFQQMVRLSGVAAPEPERRTHVTVHVAFDASRFSFRPDGAAQTISVDVAVFVDDERNRPLGNAWKRLDLSFDPGEFARLKRDWIETEVTLDVDGHPSFARGVVYEYEADQAFRTRVRLRKSS
jgi:hypothetical protein